MGCNRFFNYSHFIALKSQTQRANQHTYWFMLVCNSSVLQKKPTILTGIFPSSTYLMDIEKIVGLSNTECHGMVYPLVGKISQLIWQVSIK